MSNSDINNFRYEKKYVLEKFELEDIFEMIKNHKFQFREIYSSRMINNIYLDTLRFKSFHQNLDGFKKREKYRIRWYGNLFGDIQPKFEIKQKYAQLSTKKIIEINNIFLNKGSNVSEIRKKILLSKEINHKYKFLRFLYPTLLNRYKRRYFLSKDNKFRLTVDNKLEYFCLFNTNKIFSNKKSDFASYILELKYQKEYDDLAHFFSEFMPIRLCRNSKYVNGINSF